MPAATTKHGQWQWAPVALTNQVARGSYLQRDTIEPAETHHHGGHIALLTHTLVFLYSPSAMVR